MAAFLDGLPDEVRAALLGAAQLRRYAPGDRLLARDQPLDHLILLLDGDAKVFRETEAGTVSGLGLQRAGEVLGAVAVQRQGTYPATVTALTPIEAALWPTATVLRLLEAHPALGLKLIAVVNRRVRQMMERVDEASAVPVEQRLARVLLRAAGDSDLSQAMADRELPLLRRDLAEFAFTTVPTVSRIMSGWERRGLIESRRGRVTIRDLPALLALGRDGA